MRLLQPTPELPVRDVLEAQEYYAARLGFSIGWYNAAGRIGAVYHGDCAVFFRETDGPIAPCVHWIYTEQVDAFFEEFRRLRADLSGPPETTAWGLRQFTFRDLHGHVFHVHCDADD